MTMHDGKQEIKEHVERINLKDFLVEKFNEQFFI